MKELTTVEIKDLMNKNEKLNVIDVREADEVKTGMIPHAIHIPLGLLEFRMHELDKSKEYIMVCRSGGRSFKASQLLESHGYSVINMTGGMLEWVGQTK